MCDLIKIYIIQNGYSAIATNASKKDFIFLKFVPENIKVEYKCRKEQTDVSATLAAANKIIYHHVYHSSKTLNVI